MNKEEGIYIELEVEFSSAHSLPYDYSKKCSNTHGHNYTARVRFRYTIPDKVKYIDKHILEDIIKKVLDSKYDHKDINRTVFGNNKLPSTAENIATQLYEDINTELQNTEYKDYIELIQIELNEVKDFTVIYKIR